VYLMFGVGNSLLGLVEDGPVGGNSSSNNNNNNNSTSWRRTLRRHLRHSDLPGTVVIGGLLSHEDDDDDALTRAEFENALESFECSSLFLPTCNRMVPKKKNCKTKKSSVRSSLDKNERRSIHDNLSSTSSEHQVHGTTSRFSAGVGSSHSRANDVGDCGSSGGSSCWWRWLGQQGGKKVLPADIIETKLKSVTFLHLVLLHALLIWTWLTYVATVVLLDGALRQKKHSCLPEHSAAAAY